MAIVFDAKAEAAAWAASNTLALTVGASGRDRIVLATVVNALTFDVTSVKFAGMNMTQYGTASFWSHSSYAFVVRAYYLVGPPVGANNLVVTFGGVTYNYACVESYTGVRQTTPFPDAAQTWAVTHEPTTATLTITSQVGAMVVDFLGLGSDGSTGTGTPGGGQTARCYTSAATGGTNCGGGMSEKAGAASVVMSWVAGGAGAGIALISGYLMPSSDPRARIVAYTDDLASDDRRLLDANGNRLQPHEIRADRWIRYVGWTPPTSTVFDSLVDDPTCGYIEEVSWDSDSDVAPTTTSRMDLGEIIIARASAQSNG